MGIKENFTRALRELTGGDKEAEKKSLSDEDLEKAVEAYSNQRVREIAQNVEDLEKAVEAYSSNQRVREIAQNVDELEKNAVPYGVLLERGREVAQGIDDTSSFKTPFEEEYTPPSKDDAPAVGQSADVLPVSTASAVEPAIEPVAKPAAESVAQTGAAMPESARVSPAVTEPPKEPVAKPVADPIFQTGAAVSESPGGFGTHGGLGSEAYANTDAGRYAGSFAGPAAFSGFRQRSDADEANEITIISKNTIIDGNIRSFADMSIDGDIRGDVETTKNIELNGKVIGNITCNNAFMHRSQVQGGIRMKGNLSMKRDTLLIGDLIATYAEINGKIKGNIDVSGKAELRGDAVVFGDINAATITVEDGATIQGHVDTVSLTRDGSKNFFPEMVIIGEGY